MVRAYRAKYSGVTIAFLAQKYNRDRKTIRRWLGSEENIIATRAAHGRQRKLSDNDVREAREAMRGPFGQTCRSAGRERHVAHSTLIRALERLKEEDQFVWRRRGKTLMLSAVNKGRRLQFAMKHKDAYQSLDETGRPCSIPWPQTVFSDSKIFRNQYTRGGAAARGTWDTHGQHVAAPAAQHASLSVHVYAVCSTKGKGSALVEATGTSGVTSIYTNRRTKQPYAGVCASEYTEDILPSLLQQARQLMMSKGGQRMLWMQDKAAIHGPSERKLKRLGVKYITDWGAKMPDCNPMENLWGILEQRKNERLRECNTMDGFRRVLREEWNKLEHDVVVRTCNNMSKRLQCVIDQGGGATDY